MAESMTREPMDMNLENTSGHKPVLDKMVVRIRKIKETSEGGIHIPEGVREKDEQMDTVGLVVAMGDHCWKGLETPECKVGDMVYMDMYVGKYLTGKDGERYRLITDRMVLSTLPDGLF